ncbi:YrrS family protein [Paenibacillus sp. 7884-2]|uniref:YrrS family protein n=1 Tax=Oceanobacillus sp. FSL K6-0127 TaxID=2921420 RepID=UPI000BA5C4D8|nr:YrrS family protein [Oceanobacillus sp.]PAE31108.1 hypothetical protein CHI07_00845 [Paenibacillus sp. 7884-2]
MSESDKHSRLNKFEKRRKNTKLISIFLIAGALLIIILLGMWLFGGGDDETEEQTGNNENESSDFLITEEDEEDAEGNNPEQEESENDLASDEEAENENEENNADEEIETESAEPSDDNVAEAYTGDWSPVGTEQEGPHTTTFDEGSQDRIEMRRAITQATGLTGDDMIEWWIENGGDQKVIATVSDTAETEVFRVFLSWVDNEGWQPTKVEILIENDKK